MRVACVGGGWYPQIPGGLEKFLYGMIGELVRGGDSVDVFVNGEPSLADPGSRAFSIGRPGDPLWKRVATARAAYARSFREPYDVINIHFAMDALTLIPFIKHRTPRVMNFQGPWAAESRAEGGGRISVALKAALERFVYARCDRFIVLSGAFRDVLLGYGIDPDRISVIPMGIDCEAFHPAADRSAVRRALGWDEEATVVFTARRLVHRVGLLELVASAKLLRDGGRNVVLKIAGKGPLQDELRDRIERLGLSSSVELLGFVSEADLVRSYQAADVTVVPSQSLEGFGTIVAESLACGTPVIGTPVGGIPEALAPLCEQAITASPSAEDLAKSLDAFARGALELPCADACRAYAVERFDWSNVWKQIRAVFVSAGSK